MMAPPHFEIHACVGSTMDVAREALLSGRIRSTSTNRLRCQGVIASQQTAGRGQRGRAWHSPAGESLYVTFFYRRGLIQPATAGSIALLAGAAAADALSLSCRLAAHLLPDPVKTPFGLKWPNDLLLGDRKVGGILIELVQTPAWGWIALIGMGINLNQNTFPAELASSATSLRNEGYHPPDPISLATLIAHRIDLLADRQSRAGFTAVMRRWSFYDRTRGRNYVTETSAGPICGEAVGIASTGALLLRQKDGQLLPVLSASSLKEEVGCGPCPAPAFV